MKYIFFIDFNSTSFTGMFCLNVLHKYLESDYRDYGIESRSGPSFISFPSDDPVIFLIKMCKIYANICKL